MKGLRRPKVDQQLINLLIAINLLINFWSTLLIWAAQNGCPTQEKVDQLLINMLFFSSSTCDPQLFHFWHEKVPSNLGPHPCCPHPSLPRTPCPKGRRGLHKNDPREAQTHNLKSPWPPSRGHNSTRRPSEREKKNENADGRGKTARNSGPSTLRAPTFSGFGPPPLWGPTTPPCRGPPAPDLPIYV